MRHLDLLKNINLFEKGSFIREVLNFAVGNQAVSHKMLSFQETRLLVAKCDTKETFEML